LRWSFREKIAGSAAVLIKQRKVVAKETEFLQGGDSGGAELMKLRVEIERGFRMKALKCDDEVVEVAYGPFGEAEEQMLEIHQASAYLGKHAVGRVQCFIETVR
jgi:hypothetical protein